MPERLSEENGKSMNRMIPEGVSNCVWVDAGLVSYKLCDRDFECEECPFDQVMRQESRRGFQTSTPSRTSSGKERHSGDSLANMEPLSGLVRKFLSLPTTDTPPAGRSYTKNHLWTKEVDERRYRIGLDKYAGLLFHDPMSIILPQVGTISRRNAPLAWIILQDGTIVVRSPLDGKVSKSNFQLRVSPSLMNSDPYESGWICEVTGVEQESLVPVCFDETAAKTFYDNQFLELERTIVSDRGQKPSQVGATMNDGGTSPKDLKDILGPQRYISLLKRLLSLDV